MGSIAHIKLRSHSGFGLVELLVSVAIGLLILLAVFSVFLSTTKTDKTQDALARVQENANYVAEAISGATRRAAYRSDPQQALAYCDDPSIGFPAATIGTFSFLGCEFIRGTNSSFAIRYRGAKDGLTRDCIGALVAADAMTTEVWDMSGTNLRCSVNGGAANTMVENVGNIRYVYGVDTDSMDLARGVDAYSNAADVANWRKVSALRVEVLLQSPGEVNTERQSYSFNGSTITPTDLRLRKTYQTTFRIRN